ncbi:DUF3299 domain-containing protein [Sediminitomix flava]|uniref:DUF3299 domain-containing protein n=1 Tax=Sediminitomix flava TaxID=379075 RepID=A0A315ZE09_SEDFL|nr:DUF3299 domain-containing protein [Sediminitomix flava]PWJ43771.1 hypothetical protein BC781_101117 [Sediminitomix flava]
MLKKSLIFLLLLFQIDGIAKVDNNEELWKKLLKLDWEYVYSSTYKSDLEVPIFTKDVKALAGEEVELNGFLLPLNTEDGSLILSLYPMSSCFFCGGAGIESVVAVFPQKKEKYDLEKVTFKGTFKINRSSEGLIYQIEDAVILP